MKNNIPHDIPPLTEGMFGYSITRPTLNKEYYYDVFDTCAKFKCDLEGWHTESGPGVYEAALEFGQISEMADRASLFKYAVKSVANKYGITPSFMAKPKHGLPGCSGHTHVSVVDKDGKNLFVRETKDETPKYPDIAHLSDLGRHFLAGLLEGLPDVMPLLAPNVNSYKRLVENFWAPVTVSWGVEKKLEIPVPPLGKGQDVGSSDDQGERLAKNLKEATDRFMRKGSIAREVFGDDFVEHYGGSRIHEIRLWDEAVTDWEMKRYLETV